MGDSFCGSKCHKTDKREIPFPDDAPKDDTVEKLTISDNIGKLQVHAQYETKPAKTTELITSVHILKSENFNYC